jgi:pyrroloquinoline quinone (PQQ) biosynthesis protein C
MALIESYANTEDKAAEVTASAQTVAKALWKFLDGIYETYCQDIQSEPVAVLN